MEIDAYQLPIQLLATPLSTPKCKPCFLDQDGHHYSTSLSFDFDSHHPIDVELG